MGEIFNNLFHIARRFKVATALNLAGLIVAFAAFYLMMTQIIYQVTYNRGIEDYDRIYRLEMTGFDFAKLQWGTSMTYPIGDELLKRPQVESVSMVSDSWDWSTFIFENDFGKLICPAVLGNNTAISTLTSHAVDGSIEWTDDDQDGVIISSSIAQMYFGTTHVAGREMKYAGGATCLVRGVYQDFPDNSLPNNCMVQHIPPEAAQNITSLNYLCLVKTKKHLDPDECSQVVASLRDSVISSLKQTYPNGEKDEEIAQLEDWSEHVSFQLRPLKDTYFSNITNTDTGILAMLRMLEIICLLVIIVATVNFLNFTLAESPTRIRGINTRMVLGASRRSLRSVLVAECVITSVVACIVGLAVCQLLAQVPATAKLVDNNIALQAHPGIVAATLALAVAVGIIAGLYPAFFVTSFQAAMALKGSFGLTPQGIKLRKCLLLLQLFVSFLVIIYSSIVYLQFHYIHNSDYGFDVKHIMFVRLSDHPTAQQRKTIKEQVLNIDGVTSAAYSSQAIGTQDFYNSTMGMFDGHEVKAFSITGDIDFLKTMGIDIVEGRPFKADDPDGQCFITTQATAKKWDWAQIRPSADGDGPTLIGVCNNIRYGTTRLNTRDEPIIFWLYDEGAAWLNVRVDDKADKEGIKLQMLAILSNYGDYQPDQVSDLDSQLEYTYRYEFRFIRQMMIISLLCIIITIVGVFCLTMFETEYRRKEIAIRKVAGATSVEIIWMLCRHYGWLIGTAFAVAAPLAYFIGRLTLDQYFEERTTIHWWLFPLILLIVGGIILGIVAMQSWLTTRENPADSLKSE